jgi:hypothetical protein
VVADRQQLIRGLREERHGGKQRWRELAVDGFPAVFQLASLLAKNGGDGAHGVVITGIHEQDASGASVSGAGDVNGDGVDDLIIGTLQFSDVESAGEAYVIFGRRDSDADGLADNVDNCQLLANADQRDTNADGFGNLCDPDLDGDGIVNFTDLGRLKAAFLSDMADADFDGDGLVSFSDLGTMKSFFFSPPGPSGLAE